MTISISLSRTHADVPNRRATVTSIYNVLVHSCSCLLSQNEPLFLRTYTDAEGEEEEDANLRLHNIVHSSLDVIGERKGTQFLHSIFPRSVRRRSRFAPSLLVVAARLLNNPALRWLYVCRYYYTEYYCTSSS